MNPGKGWVMSAIHHTRDDARPETNRPVDKIATSQGFDSASGIPHTVHVRMATPTSRAEEDQS
jgi:hypothetical protein